MASKAADINTHEKRYLELMVNSVNLILQHRFQSQF